MGRDGSIDWLCFTVRETVASLCTAPEQGARKKGSGQPAMNRSKQAGMPIKTIIVLLIGLDANADGIGDFQGTHAPFGLLARTGRIQCNGQSDSASPGRDEDSLLATKPENGHAGHASLRRLACEQLDFCGEQPSNGCD